MSLNWLSLTLRMPRTMRRQAASRIGCYDPFTLHLKQMELSVSRSETSSGFWSREKLKRMAGDTFSRQSRNTERARPISNW
jgi:hypothetical protein